ncbi:MAG: AMP-binding protein [Acetobacteraceae bacterium]|nr:AMP-binding protein [Acetobacteraceae bacterium]
MSNPFLSPILARHRVAPDSLYGTFFNGEVWEQVSLGRFIGRAWAYAAAMAAVGTRSGDIVCLVLRHGWDAEAAFIGTMLANAVPSFLPYPNIKQDAHLYWRQHRLVFETVLPRLVIVYDELHDAIFDCLNGLDTAVMSSGVVADTSKVPDFLLPAPNAVALLQHSSGTTGIKKGIALSYTAICRQLDAYAATLCLTSESNHVIGTWLPFYHDMGLITSFLLPLHLGLPVAALDPFDWTAEPGLLLDAIQDLGVTHAWMPNFAFLHTARRTPRRQTWRLGGLVALINCSEPCKPQAFDAFVARFAPDGVRPEMLQTCYAMAETVFAVSQSHPGVPVRRLTVSRAAIQSGDRIAPPSGDEAAIVLLSNGRPIPGCQVRILADTAEEGRIGEIAVTAPFLFKGYHNSQAATAHAFMGGWFRTGDIGFIDDGEVYIVGRLKDVICVNGRNIAAHDAEAAASSVPGIKPGRTVAFGTYSSDTGSEQLIVIAESDADATEAIRLADEVYRAVREETGIACRVVRIVVPGWLIKTTSGKMSRYDNQRKYDDILAGERT